MLNDPTSIKDMIGYTRHKHANDQELNHGNGLYGQEKKKEMERQIKMCCVHKHQIVFHQLRK